MNNQHQLTSLEGKRKQAGGDAKSPVLSGHWTVLGWLAQLDANPAPLLYQSHHYSLQITVLPTPHQLSDLEAHQKVGQPHSKIWPQLS